MKVTTNEGSICKAYSDYYYYKEVVTIKMKVTTKYIV